MDLSLYTICSVTLQVIHYIPIYVVSSPFYFSLTIIIIFKLALGYIDKYTTDVIPALSSSDHFGLLASLICCPVVNEKPAEFHRRVWIHNRADYDLANDLLLDLNIADIVVPNDVNSSWENFNHQFLNIMELCIPSTYLPNRRSKPWLNKHLIQLIRKKNSLFKRAKHCPRLKPHYCKLRNRVTSTLHKANKNILQKYYVLRLFCAVLVR